MTNPNFRHRDQPLPLEDVRFDDEFWTPRIAANREHGIRFQYAQLEQVWAIQALDLQSRPLTIPKAAWGGTPPPLPEAGSGGSPGSASGSVPEPEATSGP